MLSNKKSIFSCFTSRLLKVITVALVYWGLLETGFSTTTQQLSCAATIIGIRFLTLKFNLSLPVLSDKTDKH